MLNVSIVIVNWNVREMLRNCLKSIYQETKDINFEIIVVDNGSKDGSVQMLRQEFPEVILIQNQDNLGFAAANNQGINRARAKYILLLNPDTLILDNAIAKTVNFMDAHPEAGIAGCKVLKPDGSFLKSCHDFPSLLNLVLASLYLHKIFQGNRFFGSQGLTVWKHDYTREVDIVAGCFMMARREAIDQVGLMDEDFFMYAEEFDWCYRFKLMGWKVIFTPEAQIIHFRGQSTKQAYKKMLMIQIKSNLHFMRKNRGFLAYLLASFLQGLFYLLRLPYWAAIVLFSARKRKEAFITMKGYALAMVTAWTGGRFNLKEK